MQDHRRAAFPRRMAARPGKDGIPRGISCPSLIKPRPSDIGISAGATCMGGAERPAAMEGAHESLERGGTPGWDRTSGFQLRRLTLYPLSYGRVWGLIDKQGRLVKLENDSSPRFPLERGKPLRFKMSLGFAHHI